jgi:hypothetical protein
MTYRTCQNIVLIGSFFLLLDILFLPPLVEKWGAVDRVDRLPQLNTPTVAAATIVKVWAYKKTGLYYCPDSKLYGKSVGIDPPVRIRADRSSASVSS